VNAHNAGVAVDVAVSVSLMRQLQLAKRHGEDFEDYFELSRRIIGREDRHLAPGPALFALIRLTWNEPDRVVWALGLDDEIDAYVAQYDADRSRDDAARLVRARCVRVDVELARLHVRVLNSSLCFGTFI